MLAYHEISKEASRQNKFIGAFVVVVPYIRESAFQNQKECSDLGMREFYEWENSTSASAGETD